MKNYVLLALISATSITAHAADFRYQGKPIHPSCIADITINNDNNTASVNLAKCNSSKEKIFTDKDYYTNRDENDQSQQSFTAYTVIGNQGNKFLLDTGSWTGGSGFFTSIIWVELTKDQLKLIATINGGDRCNGGTHKTGNWEYGINDTPFDILTRATGKQPTIKPYDDLESSAASCAAESIYRFDPATMKSTFIEMRLNDEPLSMDDYINNIKYQRCFNNIYNQWLKNGKTILKQSDIDAFRTEFDKTCLK